MDNWHWGLLWGLAYEFITCVFRFGLRRTARRDMAWIGRWTWGIRLHHGYLGGLALLAAWPLPPGLVRSILVQFGVAMIVSDAVHHFLVLWPVTGSPEFDLFYRSPGAGDGPSRFNGSGRL